MSDDLLIRKNSKLAFKPTAQHLADSFRELAEELAIIGSQHQTQIRPYKNAELPYFTQLSLKDQQSAVMRLAQYVSICQDVLASGGTLKDSRTFAWRAMKSFGFVPTSNLFTSIRDDDVIEIYNVQNVQIFRNFEFFKFCSYTIEDLYTRSWPELFVREDHSHTERSLNLVAKLIGEKSRETVYPNIGVQIAIETESDQKTRVTIEIKAISVLFNEDDMAEAFISIERLEHLEASKNQKRVEPLENHSPN